MLEPLSLPPATELTGADATTTEDFEIDPVLGSDVELDLDAELSTTEGAVDT